MATRLGNKIKRHRRENGALSSLCHDNQCRFTSQNGDSNTIEIE